MAKKKIMIIVPSRSEGTGRENNVLRFIESWRKHSDGLSDLCIGLDSDDAHNYKNVPNGRNIIQFVSERQRMVPTLNKIALYFAKSYEMIAFFGDDHIIKSQWEYEFFLQHKKQNSLSISYGNDLLQGQRLPTAVCLSSSIIKELGYMVPPNLVHLFADNFWLDMGNELGCLNYYPNVIFEHLHPDAQKAESDVRYVDANSTFNYDMQQYADYKNSGNFTTDIEKLKSLKKSLCTDKI